MDFQTDILRVLASTLDEGVTISIQGANAVVKLPGMEDVKIPISSLMKKLAVERQSTGGVVLPDGVKSVLSERGLIIWVYECPPRVHSLSWIANDSPEMSGPGAKYRTVRIALPYVIVLAVFVVRSKGVICLSNSNEVFFRTEPLKSLDDKLFCPALLNCGRFNAADDRPISWLCTQSMSVPREARDQDPNVSMRAYFRALLHCLFESSFNLSFEQHNIQSWYTVSSQIDPRLRPIEEWEAASRRDPLFVLEVPWIPTGLSVREVCQRIFSLYRGSSRNYQTARDLAAAILAESGLFRSGPGARSLQFQSLLEAFDGPF